MKINDTIEAIRNYKVTHELQVKDELYLNSNFMLAVSELPEA